MVHGRLTIKKVLSVMVVAGLLLLHLKSADAETRTEYVVAPARVDTLASSVLFRTLQTSTEYDFRETQVNQSRSPYEKLQVGLDNQLSSRITISDIPVLYSLTPNYQLRLDVPFVSVTNDTPFSGSSDDIGLGDISLSLNIRTEIEKTVESFFILTPRLPSGNANRGLGSGSVDYAVTHKTRITHGDYRTTLMAGLTLSSLSDATILGNSVHHGPTVVGMVATEQSPVLCKIRYGVKVAGLYGYSSKINAVDQSNAVGTIDLIPEITYRTADSYSFKAGIILPFYTSYDLLGAAQKRDVMLNLSVYKYF